MLGYVKASDVMQAIKEAREDIYKSNMTAHDPDSPLSRELCDIVKQAGAALRKKQNEEPAKTACSVKAPTLGS